jgi:hypothetical protein
VIPHSGIEPARRLVGLSSMKFKLKTLHRNGAVLTLEELADSPGYVGTLIVEDWPQGGVFARHIRQARLVDMTIQHALCDIIPPLFDPQLIRAVDNQMVLHGYQIHVDGETGAIRHDAQCWVLCAVTDE